MPKSMFLTCLNFKQPLVYTNDLHDPTCLSDPWERSWGNEMGSALILQNLPPTSSKTNLNGIHKNTDTGQSKPSGHWAIILALWYRWKVNCRALWPTQCSLSKITIGKLKASGLLWFSREKEEERKKNDLYFGWNIWDHGACHAKCKVWNHNAGFSLPTILQNEFLSLYQFISMSFVQARDCLNQWRAKWVAFNLTLLLSPTHLLKGELRGKNWLGMWSSLHRWFEEHKQF